MQIGRFAEYWTKLKLVSEGLDTFTSEVDDRGIDFVIRQEPNHYWDVQVKSSRNLNYVFIRKDKTTLAENKLLALVLFEDGEEPESFLIPLSRWITPSGIFVSRDYVAAKSQPEYGLQLSRKGLCELEPYRFDAMIATLFHP
ncbi:hypothetical protein [Actibacterium atlanticum]|nr:hypothetical protein [Actibacterium atlanticum]